MANSLARFSSLFPHHSCLAFWQSRLPHSLLMTHTEPAPLSSRYRLEAPSPLHYPLVNRFYKQCGYSVKCGRMERVYIVREIHTAEIHAAVRFLPQNDCWLLRNLCVVPHRRRAGLASLLLTQTLQSIVQPAITTGCYCFSLGHLERFYQEQGFQTMEPEQIPVPIAKSYRRYKQNQPDLTLMGLAGRLQFP